MAITLQQALLNANDAIDRAIIDEFIKSTWLLGQMPFDQAVSPGTGGATLVYGYTRQVTQRTAHFRAIGTEYTPTEVTKQPFTVGLRPLGGTFVIDRVLDEVARGAETAFQLRELTKATRARFSDAVINGDVEEGEETDAPLGFDGLSVALAGTETEFDGAVWDWTVEMDRPEAIRALMPLRRLLASLDGPPTALLTNTDGLLALETLGQLTQTVQPLTGFGEVTSAYRGVPIIDLGAKPGTNEPVIPTNEDGETDIYAVRLSESGFHGVATRGGNLIKTWMPDFGTAGANKVGEVEMGPVAVVLKRTKAAGVLRGIKVLEPSGS